MGTNVCQNISFTQSFRGCHFIYNLSQGHRHGFDWGGGADSDWGVDSVKSTSPLYSPLSTSHCTDSPLAKYLGPDQAPMIKTASRTLRKLSVSFISTNTSSILTFEITETNQNSPAHCWMDDILMCHEWPYCNQWYIHVGFTLHTPEWKSLDSRDFQTIP